MLDFALLMGGSLIGLLIGFGGLALLTTLARIVLDEREEDRTN